MPSLSSILKGLGDVTLFASVATVTAVPKRASCTVASVSDAANISGCTSVTIKSFTVPSGQTLVLNPSDGTTVAMVGDVTFAKTTSSGPLFTIDGSNIKFKGAGHKFDGNGAKYWDGQGTNGGVTKPHPFLKFKGSGQYSSFTVLNSPAQAISIGNSDGLTFDTVTVDNSAGDSGSLGHNTDGFDVSADNVTIQNSVVKNQDDCIAINDGSNIVFQNNQCSGGHGISVGSIASGKHVSGVAIKGNTVTNSMYGMRVKVKAAATSASVSAVTYSGNTISAIAKYGFLVSQSYPDDASTPGTGAPISGINFSGDTTNIKVNSGAKRVTVDCRSCTGTWNWSKLTATGGSAGTISSDKAKISGGSY
uniref:endo-polygalacturonase n=1 Tax=Chondrostereum purpureum TaxID=58369 RepID=Q9P8M5_9AGAR|nr:endopolygalacturonase [Chondrostereum purpureum]